MLACVHLKRFLRLAITIKVCLSGLGEKLSRGIGIEVGFNKGRVVIGCEKNIKQKCIGLL